MTFIQKLADAQKMNRSLLCVGLDPDPERMPCEDAADFLGAVVEATRDLVCAYKPNLAFYEGMGESGMRALRDVLRAVPDEVPVIGDAKRGDIGNTARAYARALFDDLGLDAATVNPYLGGDAVEPFLSYADRGIFILCRSSNPGARDLQDLAVDSDGETLPLYEVVAERAKNWNSRGNVGLVVGATYPDDLRRLRARCPEMPFLLPGVGAQAGDVVAAVRAGLDRNGAGIIVSASRAVIYASSGRDFAAAARAKAVELRDAIDQQRRAAAGT